jgi:glycosyltransferase involved in cell wall biosynthesis
VRFTLCITCWSQDVHMLNETLSAFKRQTEHPNEIVIVGNDLKDIKVEDPRIITFAEPTRRSPSFNRNKGAELATGDVIIYHDVDDIPHRQKIELIKKAFTEHDVDAFVHGFNINDMHPFNYSDLDIEKITELKDDKYLKSSAEDLSHGHLSIKREIVNELKYNEGIFFGEDADFCKRLFLSGRSIYYGNHKLINCRPSYEDSFRKWYNV